MRLMAQPLGFLLTWTAYGTWLPGDQRGWVDDRDGAWHVPVREPDPARVGRAESRMPEESVTLNDECRLLVARTIEAASARRGWRLRAVNARSNHVHVVVTPEDVEPGRVLGFLKKECTKALNAACGRRRRWWTKGGSKRYLNDERSLHGAI